MLKFRSDVPINWGVSAPGGAGFYCSAVSGGSYNTMCNTKKYCTAAWAREFNSYGLINATSSRGTISGFGSERIESSSRGGYDKFKPCHHYREGIITNYPYSGALALSSTSVYIHRFYRDALTVQSTPVLENHSFTDLSAAQSRAWHAMQPEFSGNISMINFLFELSEVKNLLRDSLLAIKHVRNLIRRLRSGRGPKNLDPTKPIAEAHLQYQFGIKPLVADLVEIVTQLYTQVLALQEQFALDGLRNNVRHYTEEQIASSTLPSTSGRGTASVTQSVFTATMDYSYEYDLRSPTEALIKYWGLELSAEAIWNALPFSFLADYFYKIGKAIALMEHDPHVRLQLARYGESLKTSKSVGVHVQIIPQGGPMIINDKLVSSGIRLVSGRESILYTRYPSLPNKGIAVPMIGSLNDKKKANMAALLRCLL